MHWNAHRLKLTLLAGVVAICISGIYWVGPFPSKMTGEYELSSSESGATFYPEGTTIVKECVVDDTQPISLALEVGPGDTFAKLLSNEGVSSQQIHKLALAMTKHYSPKNLKPDHEIQITKVKPEAGAEGYDLQEIRIKPDMSEEIRVTRVETEKGYEFKSEKHTVELVVEAKYAEGEIAGSLYEAALKYDVPAGIIHDMIMAYSYDIDFQRSLRKGDTYELMYTVDTDPETGRQKSGRLLYASLNLQGKPYSIYNFKPKNDAWGYYNALGESVRKGLLRTPVDGARLSSGFGKRRHPILGYTRQHKGVDFAAPRGTPIMAAGNGTVESLGRNGGYGNYIRIRHNGEYSTAYAHMSRYAKGLKKGQRVKQGQVIGFIGTTGLSSGAHLHYEVLRNRQQINPLSVKMMAASKLKGQQLLAFKEQKEHLNRQYAALRNKGDADDKEVLLAMADATEPVK